jgi:outer membrane protein OmpA-like peptidoglycan-associated protein
MRPLSSMMRFVSLIAVIPIISSCAQNRFDRVNARNKIIQPEQVEYTSDKPVVMFILDTSGSMADIEGNEAKMETAKSSIIDTISQIDQDRYNTSLITFADGDSCQVDIAVPPNNSNPETIINKVKAIKPSGATPLASAIAMSGRVLDKVDKKLVILFSDGKESCNGDPVGAAKLLDEQYGIKINLQVIGYAVDKTTAKQLQEIAQINSEWAYHDAEDANSLSKAIDDITKQGNLLATLWTDVNTSTFQFGTGSTELKNEYMENINKIYAYLKNNQKRIEIIGHTDSIGAASLNSALSIERANMVKSKLVEQGIQENRIEVTGRGEEEPISSNETEAGRLKNRRVVIRVL